MVSDPMGPIRPAPPLDPLPRKIAMLAGLDQMQRADETLDIRCSRRQIRGSKSPQMLKEVNRIICDAHVHLALTDQADIYMRAASLLQFCKLYEYAEHYLLACAGLVRVTDDQHTWNISDCVCKHTTLPVTGKYASHHHIIESMEISLHMDHVKMNAMARLAWNSAKWYIEQLSEEERTPKATPKNYSADLLYRSLKQHLNYVHSAKRFNLLSPEVLFMLKEAESYCKNNPPPPRPARESPQ